MGGKVSGTQGAFVLSGSGDDPGVSGGAGAGTTGYYRGRLGYEP